MRAVGRIVAGAALGVMALGAVTWGAAALWFDGPAARPLAGSLAAAFVIGQVALVVAVRPRRRAAGAGAALFAVVLAWWLAIPARNDRPWLPDVAELPRGDVVGHRLTITNVRNFTYRSETAFTPHWETRTYDLTAIRGMDLFLSYWSGPAIAHTIVSWEFADGPPLAISIETRKEVGETYSAIGGFFRQYELYYVVADERDVIGVRTIHRGEQVFLYRLRTPPARARKLLLDYVDEINRLAREPVWYNAFTHNCTTTIQTHVQQAGIPSPWDWRLLVNGYLDEALYEDGVLNTTLPFPTLRARSDITAVAKAADASAEFSRRIRDGLPGRPPPPA